MLVSAPRRHRCAGRDGATEQSGSVVGCSQDAALQSWRLVSDESPSVSFVFCGQEVWTELDGVLAEYVRFVIFKWDLAGRCELFTNSDCILAVILTKTAEKCRVCWRTFVWLAEMPSSPVGPAEPKSTCSWTRVWQQTCPKCFFSTLFQWNVLFCHHYIVKNFPTFSFKVALSMENYDLNLKVKQTNKKLNNLYGEAKTVFFWVKLNVSINSKWV